MKKRLSKTKRSKEIELILVCFDHKKPQFVDVLLKDGEKLHIDLEELRKTLETASRTGSFKSNA